MRVALLTTTRFTLVDLARELNVLGHEALVYSLVPPWHTRRFGLAADSNRWLGPYVAPLFAASRLARGSALNKHADSLLSAAVDTIASVRIEPCDVLVAMSGIGVRSLVAVRKRYGAKIFLERSSRHILSQREILEAIPGTGKPVTRWAVQRELAGYDLTDVVSVPSRQVEESFLERGFPQTKLYRNPFGASLDQFLPTLAPPAEPKTVLMTGTWSLQKGCDVLARAFRMLSGVKLLHVGGVTDAPLPTEAWFEHIDAVPQERLPAFYARAHVFVMASRQEGLAVVQAQALACGVRLVCTTRTGGADFEPWTTEPGAVTVVAPDDALSLSRALATALEHQPAPGTMRDLFGANRSNLSWAAYAQRYEKRMLEALGR